MDSIFEEDADEVGGEIEAYCPSPRCKADTTHTIISMYEDEVRRVQCVVCGEVHAYRKPRGDGTEEAAEGAAKKSTQKRMTWDDAMARATDADLANCRPYSIRDAYEEGDVVHHPVFDIGFVIDLLPDNKVEVIFRDGGSRVLVHNRGDLASRMPDISEIPVPREAKKKKRAKKPGADGTLPTVPARSKAQVEEAVLRARGAAQMRMDEAQKTADERNKKLKDEAKKSKGKGKAPATPAKVPVAPAKAAANAKAPAAKAAPAKAAPAKGLEKPAAKVAKAPANATAKPAKPAKPAAKPVKKAPAKKPPAKKPAAKPAAKPVKKAPAKKPSKPAPKKKK
ncbi:MAG: hypothetical protein H0T89_08820 [Deltaproteobacteria bacterium]|nr:hypothetical protein [Deltaproteobacteria bacterium]MDQ3297446.1 hypothetical protein [Myxococcota bacterium]